MHNVSDTHNKVAVLFLVFLLCPVEFPSCQDKEEEVLLSNQNSFMLQLCCSAFLVQPPAGSGSGASGSRRAL